MKALFIVSIVFSSFQDTNDKPVKWHNGVIVLSSEEILQGEISPSEYDLVLFRSNNTVKVIPAHRLKSIHFYDKKSDINRKFVSKASCENKRVFQLYEVVLWGEINLLRKQNAAYSSAPLHDKHDFTYYIESENNLITLRKFRGTVFPLMMANYHQEMLSFMEKNKLNPNVPADAVQLIAHYNKLVQEQPVVARH